MALIDDTRMQQALARVKTELDDRDSAIEEIQGAVSEMGDDVSELKSAIINTVTYAESSWEKKGVSFNTGIFVDSTTRSTLQIKGVCHVICTSSYKIALVAFNGSTYLGAWTGTEFSKTEEWKTEIYVPKYDYTYYIIFAKSNNGNLGSSDYSNVTFDKYTFYTKSETDELIDTVNSRIDIVNAEISDILVESINVFNYANYQKDKSLNSSGVVIDAPGYGLAETIDVRSTDIVTFSAAFTYFGIYDNTGTWVERRNISYDGNARQIDTTNIGYIAPIATDGYMSKSTAYIVLSDYSGGYVPYDPKHFNNTYLDIDYIRQHIDSGTTKTIICFGDSLVRGYGNNDVGFVDIYAQKYGHTCLNYAVSGATITNISSRACIYDQVLAHLTDEADLCIVGGLTNDCNTAYEDGKIGQLETSYTASFDKNFFCGALECILRDCKQAWRKVVFVLPFNMDSRNAQAQSDLRELVLQACKKWSVEVVDMYAYGGINTNLSYMKSTYTDNGSGTPDGTHPNQLGYDMFYIPQIAPVFNKQLID